MGGGGGNLVLFHELMIKKRSTFLLTFLLLAIGACYGQAPFANGVEITTIKAPWSMRIMNNGLDITNVKVRPDQRSAYFMMVSESRKLNVSVYIEPVDECKSSDECRDHVLGLGNPAWGKFQDLSKGKIKDFSYFEFYRPEIDGQPVKMQDMYAEYVDKGYWIDLHISKVLYSKDDHALFENIVNSVNFVPRSSPGSAGFDMQNKNAADVSANWLAMWDASKCSETYTALSSITRSENSEKSWVDYCNKVTTFLGAKKSRTLIGSAFTASLPPKTEGPVAILAFQSDFANRQGVIEIVALMQEKNGKWIVTNYLPQ
jgi:hypothetical protein